MEEKLILKPIKDLLGENFYIPHYQRGYRWTSQQVKDLLNDIWAFIKDEKTIKGALYCLQPIVVKTKTWENNGTQMDGWEVIDGQQRLTTIYIILSYLTKEFLKVESLEEDYGKGIYTLRYQTRPHSETFLKNITADKSNIDFYYISEAYREIKLWFSSNLYTIDRNDRNKFLGTLLGKKDDDLSVQIIWYRVDQTADSIELFNRLNIGKIPLTNAELIKALFLSTTSFDGEDAIAKRIEISQIWDSIEQKLNEPDGRFWSFVTNAVKEDYSTKIDLIFDLVAKKGSDTKDPLHTFLHFLNKSKDNKEPLWDVWLKIEQYYQTLCQWYRDKNLYHKIGYLITVGYNQQELIDESLIKMKVFFETGVDEKIRKSVNIPIDELSYENDNDKKRIEQILLLFNVESIRTNDHITDYYPFKSHKKTDWSLEHIHAQKSESLSKTNKLVWLKWLDYHRQLIAELQENESNDAAIKGWAKLIKEIEDCSNEKITWERFNELSGRIIDVFSEQNVDKTQTPHSISNLALLGQPENAALNNSVFEVKRREIIKMDKAGNYIPICTRRAFLKYYNNQQSSQQYLFWSTDDRQKYLVEIKKVLKYYLPFENINQSV